MIAPLVEDPVGCFRIRRCQGTPQQMRRHFDI